MQVDELLEFDSNQSIEKVAKLNKTEELLMEEKIRLVSYWLKHGHLYVFGRILGNYYGMDYDNLDFSDDNAGLNIEVKLKITPKIFKQISTLRHTSDNIILVGLIFYLGHRNNHRVCRSRFLWINN